MSEQDFSVHTRRVWDAERAIRLPQCKLVVLKGSQRGRELTVTNDIIRIGKSESNDLVLSEDTVSRLHCEIVRDGKGYLLRDLQSTNGTFLDGAEVREAYVHDGSVITVGTVQIKFQPFDERIEITPSQAEQLGGLVGRSLFMREIFCLLERVGPTEATILVEGETGTGKDLVAQTIHLLSRRREGPFIVAECDAAAGTLIESELFGHEKGAFIGATAARQGAFELAHQGTLFLDELGELSLELQSKLLRVLEQREIRRLGGDRTVRVDIRVIAATRRDLKQEVQKGKFREDLYLRLSVVPIYLPPLRERKDDIALLVQEFGRQLLGGELQFPPDAMEHLLAHDWPGNVRELRNVIERGISLAKQREPDAFKRVNLSGLGSGPPRLEDGQGQTAPVEFQAQASYRANKERWNDVFEQRYLRWLLARTKWNISKAAREADMDRKYLHKLIKKHNLAPPRGID